MTQREKLQILIPKIKAHDFFEHGPYMISRREAEVIIKAMEHHLTNLEDHRKRYLNDREEHIRKAQERYRKKKMEVFNDLRT